LQALQSAQRSRKVLAVAPVVAQAAPVVGPEAALAAARALVPGLAAQAQAQAVLELEMAAQAEPAAAAASPMSSGADKVLPVLPACATKRPHRPTAPRRVASGSRLAILQSAPLLLRA
jgi:hypothetical protein